MGAGCGQGGKIIFFVFHSHGRPCDSFLLLTNLYFIIWNRMPIGRGPHKIITFLLLFSHLLSSSSQQKMNPKIEEVIICEKRKKKTETNLENLFPRLVVFCLLLSSLSFTPTKRYEEVDGVRKEKERLTTDHQPPNSYLLFSWCEISRT